MITDRQLDELHIAWLEMRDQGASYAEIARHFRVRADNVRKYILRIQRDYRKSEEAQDGLQ